MRKLLLLGAIFLSQLVTTQVQGFFEGFEIEGRVAYLYPTDKRIRDVYGKNGFAEYQVEAAMPLNFLGDCCCDTPLVGFFNASYFQKRGHARCRFETEAAIPSTICTDDFCLRNKTRIEHWLLTAGAKYYFECFECIRPYLGFGLGAAGVRLREHFRDGNSSNVTILDPTITSSGRNRNDRWGFAILAKSGIEYDLTCNIFLDGFVDYSYAWFSRDHKGDCSSKRRLDTGAVKAGLGLGYRF
jgi:opacity protein-like surface antigen